MNKLEILQPPSNSLLNDMIDCAVEEIIISRHSIPSTQFCNKLISAKHRGVRIYLLLSSPYYFQDNGIAEISAYYGIHTEIVLYSQSIASKRDEHITKLIQHRIYPRYINHNRLFLNHSMYIIIDSKLFYLGSAPNETCNRLDVGLVSNDIIKLNILKNLFNADYHDKDLIMSGLEKHGIAIAPYNMRIMLEDMLSSARYAIYMMFPVVTDDPRIINILQKKITNGLKIQILCSPEMICLNRASGLNYTLIKNLLDFGIAVKEVYTPQVHCRCIIIDPEDISLKKLYIGSGNLKKHSFDLSREVGFVTDNIDFCSKMFDLFNKLWGIAQ